MTYAWNPSDVGNVWSYPLFCKTSSIYDSEVAFSGFVEFPAIWRRWPGMHNNAHTEVNPASPILKERPKVPAEEIHDGLINSGMLICHLFVCCSWYMLGSQRNFHSIRCTMKWSWVVLFMSRSVFFYNSSYGIILHLRLFLITWSKTKLLSYKYMK